MIYSLFKRVIALWRILLAKQCRLVDNRPWTCDSMVASSTAVFSPVG